MNSNFFESLETSINANCLWVKYTPSMKGPVLFEGELMKHSKTGESEIQTRYFLLQQDYLLYKKSKDADTITSAMLIKFAKLVLPGHDETDHTPSSVLKAKFPLKICYKNKYSLLYAKNQEDYDRWIAAFTKVLTRTDFHHRFEVSKIIGSGAFANVYEATLKESGDRFAVKGFNKNFLENDQKGRLSLWNEITVLKGLDHRNLLHLYEVHETKNSIYLVFNIIEGGELAKYIENKPKGLPEEEIVKIIFGLLQGLDYMADRSLAHRDIKPSNIMLRKTSDLCSDDVVIVDFGLAASVMETDLIYRRCGTPGYIAPEIIAAKNVDSTYQIPERCDLFSVGVIMYVLCTGSNPFEKPGSNVDAILKMNMESKIEYPPIIFKRFSQNLMRLLKGLLHPEPRKRLTAFEALRNPLFDNNLEGGTLFEESEDQMTMRSRECDDISASFGTIKSLLRRKAQQGEMVNRSNDSIGVNSTGGIDIREQISSPKKLPHTNLYKQSLMKGKNSSRSRASSKDRSAENSPAHSIFSSSNLSSVHSRDNLYSPKGPAPQKSPKPLAEKKPSYFAPLLKN